MGKEKYIGTKFKTIFEGKFFPDIEQKKLIRQLIKVGQVFKKLGLIDANGGNISVRSFSGFVIKRTGASPDKLSVKDFVFVAKTSGNKVFVLGESEPSSEARLHGAIYKMRPDVGCILHGHDFVSVNCLQKFSDIGYVPELPYGSIESAKAVSQKSKKFDYIIQENHGVVALGEDVSKALNLLKKQHARFSKITKSSAKNH